MDTNKQNGAVITIGDVSGGEVRIEANTTITEGAQLGEMQDQSAAFALFLFLQAMPAEVVDRDHVETAKQATTQNDKEKRGELLNKILSALTSEKVIGPVVQALVTLAMK